MFHAGGVGIGQNMSKSISGILVRGHKASNDALQTSNMDEKDQMQLLSEIWDPSMTSQPTPDDWLEEFIPFKGRKEFQKELMARAQQMINQGDIGGCSMATLLNMIQLQQHSYPKKELLKIMDSCNICSLQAWPRLTEKSDAIRQMEFRKLYHDRLRFPDDGFANWVTFMMNMEKTCPELLKELTLVPLRRRQDWNAVIAGECKSWAKYYRAVENYIEEKLKAGFSIGVPFLQHFFVIIGYNSSHYLLINSYGPNAGHGGLWQVPKEYHGSELFFAASIDQLLLFKDPWAGNRIDATARAQHAVKILLDFVDM